MVLNTQIAEVMNIRLDDELPELQQFQPGIRRAPDRGFRLTRSQTKTALQERPPLYSTAASCNTVAGIS